MLAMNLTLMRGMSTGHLLASLDAEGHLTPAQIELADRLEIAEDELIDLRKNAEELAEENSSLNSKKLEFEEFLKALDRQAEDAKTLEELQNAIEGLLYGLEF